MNIPEIKTVTVIGAGNVATHLAKALLGSGKVINCVYSRTQDSAVYLASRVSAKAITQLSQLPADSDLYIIALPDAVVPSVISSIHLDGNLIVHTSGTLAADILANVSENYGVFYPFQTFSIGRALDFRHVPVCIESPKKENEVRLTELAQEITSSVSLVTSEKRALLHVAGVFACNFTNLNYVIAEEILRENNISFDLIKPLIRETASKVMGISPLKVQTGPAVREDRAIMDKHVELLASKPEYASLYNTLSKLIIKKKNDNGQL
ncbi:MAG: Rossmann-like and DUF2520 domain-containing protein [Bacteroidota bacterium]